MMECAVEWAYQPSWFRQPAPHQAQQEQKCSTGDHAGGVLPHSNASRSRHRWLRAIQPTWQWLAVRTAWGGSKAPCHNQTISSLAVGSEVARAQQDEGSWQQRLVRVADKEAAASDRPALEAVLRLYQYLYRSVLASDIGCPSDVRCS